MSACIKATQDCPCIEMSRCVQTCHARLSPEALHCPTPLSGTMVPPAGCCGDQSDPTSHPYSFSFPLGKSGLKFFYTISSSSLRLTNSILGDAFFYVFNRKLGFSPSSAIDQLEEWGQSPERKRVL